LTARQQVLMLWLANPSLDSRVLGWSFFDGTAGRGPQLTADPPYPSGLEALVDGWRLLQMSPLVPPMPGHERDTSFLKHEFVFERMTDLPEGTDSERLPVTRVETRGH
jgi:hypothetical protein